MTEDPQKTMIRDTRVIIGLLAILCAMGLGAIVYQMRVIVLPFALAVFISYIMNPLISFFEKRRVPVSLSILIVVIITFFLLGMIGWLINTSVQAFAAEFPRYEARVELIGQNLIQLLNLPPELFEANTEGSERWQMLSELENFSITGVITSTLTSITKFLSNTFLVLLFLAFILMGRNNLTKKLAVAFDSERAQKLINISTNINSQIQKYILTKTLISLITSTLVTIVLFLFGVEFAMIWGILTFLLNFVPNVGSILATVLPMAIAVIQFDNPIIIVWVAIVLIAIQVVMGNLVDPRLVGRSINLSPLVVLGSLIFWGWLLGLVGMFLATPLSVIIKIILENIQPVRFVSVLMSASPEET